MIAALITGARRLELREFPEPTPHDDGVVVDVSYCGVCGTDVHAYTSGRSYRAAICGHEWTGTVSAIGRRVSQFAEGDRVIIGVPGPCGSCTACRAAQPDHCTTTIAFVHGRDSGAPLHGGFAPRIAVDAGRVIAAHPALDDETLAQVEPVTVALHAVNRSTIREGDVAVVVGGGPVGLTTMQCATAAGARLVVLIEPSDARRAVASALGVHAVASASAAQQLVEEQTRGLGADVVFDCVGSSSALATAVDLSRRGGSVCIVGLGDGALTIEPADWLRKEITVTTALGYVHDEFITAMALLADGTVCVDLLHTATTSIGGLDATLADLASGTTAQVKVLVRPTW